MADLIKFTNCYLLRDHKIIKEDLWVRAGKIINPEKTFFDEKQKPHIIVDMLGCTIAPGYIDIQINGGFGIDFSYDIDSVEMGLKKVAKGILAHGVTSFCPTLVTSSKHNYKTILPKLQKQPGGINGAEILGVHLEGPFINKEKRGAHAEDLIQEFTNGFTSVLDVYGNLDNVVIVTLAPEKENAMEIIKALNHRGITVSLGHSEANINTGETAVCGGARLITHLFNAMLPFHHRDPGLVGLLASDCTIPIYYGVIADGVHTHPSSLRIAHRTHPKGVVLVTDAIAAMGFEDGVYHIGPKDITVTGNLAYITNTQTLCGSVANMETCVKYFQKAAGCTTVEALEAATLHPAQALRIDSTKGTLNYGADADFIALDSDLNVLSTWIAGCCVYASCDWELKYPQWDKGAH